MHCRLYHCCSIGSIFSSGHGAICYSRSTRVIRDLCPWIFLQHYWLETWCKNTTLKRTALNSNCIISCEVFILCLQPVQIRLRSQSKQIRSFSAALLLSYLEQNVMFPLPFVPLKTLADPLSLIRGTWRMLMELGRFTAECWDSMRWAWNN